MTFTHLIVCNFEAIENVMMFVTASSLMINTSVLFFLSLIFKTSSNLAGVEKHENGSRIVTDF